MARFALAAPKVQRYYSSLGTPNYFNNNMGGLWADVVNNRRNEAFDDLKWEQDVLTQDQRMSHMERMQKLQNDHAERMGDVGKNNKFHALAQGAVGLGASYGASGGFDNLFGSNAAPAATADVGVGAKIADTYPIAPSAEVFGKANPNLDLDAWSKRLNPGSIGVPIKSSSPIYG